MERVENGLQGYGRKLAITAYALCACEPVVHLTLPSEEFTLMFTLRDDLFPPLASSNVTALSLRPCGSGLADSTVVRRAEAFAAVSPRLTMLCMLAAGRPLQDCLLDQPLSGLRCVKLRDVALPRGLGTFSGMPGLRSLDLHHVFFEPTGRSDALPASLTNLSISSDDPLPDFVTPPGLKVLSLAGSMQGTHAASRVTITSTALYYLYLSSVDALHSGPSALMDLTSLRELYLDSVGGPLYRHVVGPMWRAIPSLRKVTLNTQAGQSWQWDVPMLGHVIDQRMQMIHAGRRIVTGRHLKKAVWGMVGSLATVRSQGHREREMQIVFLRVQVTPRFSSSATSCACPSPSPRVDSPDVLAAGSLGAGTSASGRPPSPRASRAWLRVTTAAPPPAAPTSLPPTRP